eukprot:TRINITY_DN24359_c0_g1_i1.p1 TRINITY_DN24359_c0_g1~~TRINITY_DN24359_c0_g1_i1.p1  ORF type:complete len:372 (+),score=46.78 TRINITY_DN24359_c0_g1_i1:48-1163(+)
MASVLHAARAQVGFFSTGVLYVVAIQQADYWGMNGSTSLLAPTALFFAMLYGGAIQVAVSGRFSALKMMTPDSMRTCFTIGILTFMDNIISMVGIDFLGSMIFNIFYSWVLVATALFRVFILKRRLSQGQWSGVIIVTVGLSCAGTSSIDAGPNFDVKFLLGFLATMIAATCDAYLYVLVEGILGTTHEPRDICLSTPLDSARIIFTPKVSPSELVLCTGSVTTFFCAPIGMLYGLSGYWKQALDAQLDEHAGGRCADTFGVALGTIPSSYALIGCWILGGTILYLHYYYFFVLVACVSNAVVAGITKATQSIAIFFVVAFLYGDCDERQAVTSTKIYATTAVIVGTLVYSLSEPYVKPSSCSMDLCVQGA